MANLIAANNNFVLHGLTIQPLLMDTAKSVLKTLFAAEMLSFKFLSNLPSTVKEAADRFYACTNFLRRMNNYGISS